MHRRSFLRSSAVVGSLLASPAALAACASGGSSDAAQIPEGEPTLVPIVASMELLTGTDQKIAFALRTLENEPVPDADPQVFLRTTGTQDEAGEVVAGPFEARAVEDTGVAALYATEISADQGGTLEFVVVAGDDFGTQAINAVAPEESGAPVVGDKATSVATPTMKKPLGFAEVCTANPPCGMHEVSLDEALSQGRPIMLTFATPAYCQTVVCGPAVDNVDAARQSGDFGDVAWIHAEIYSDEGQTIGKPVQAWELPSEPWVFGVDGTGTITARLDGPIVPDWVAQIAQDLAA